MKPPSRKQPPAKNGAFSEFMRNAPAHERKRVFTKVIEGAIAEQRKIVEQSKRMQQHAVAKRG